MAFEVKAVEGEVMVGGEEEFGYGRGGEDV